MARIDSKPPYDASFPKVGSGEFSRIAKEAAKKRREEKEKESMYAVTDAAVVPSAEELLPQKDKEITTPSTLKEPKTKENLLTFPCQSFREDIPWAVNGVSISKAEKEATPKAVMPPLAAQPEEKEPLNIDSIFDPHIDRAGNRVSLREDAPWAKDNPYAFGLEQGFQNQNKFAGKPYDELDKDAVIKSNSLTMGIIGSDPVMKKELNRRKDKLRDFEFIANTPGALASYGLTLTQDEWERIKGEILSGTDSLKDLTPLLHKAKTLRYEEGKEKQETISQVSDRARQLTSEMERAGATKEADQAIKTDAFMASGLPSSTSAQIWKTTSYNDKLPDTYRATLHLQDHADELSQMNKSVLSNLKKDKSWTGGVWEGFKNNILTRKAWQDKEGNTYAANEMALYRVIQAYNRGDNSPEVKAVVEMAAELNSAEYFMRSLLPKGYEAGESTAGSVPFMIDFIVTSVLTGGAGSAEKAASKVGASGVKALATRGVLTASGKGTRFLELLARYGQKAAQGVKGVATAVAEKAPHVTRMGGRIVKDATQAAIMTATLNTPSVVSDAERRVTPIPYKLEEGDIADMSEFIPINDDHILMEKRFMESNRNKALRKAFTAQWIENYTEMAGGHFDTYLKALGKLTHFSGTAAGKAIARFNNALSKAPVVGSVRRAANIQGLGGQFTEEMYGGMLNAWLVGDQSMKEVFDAKNMGTTLEALLPTQVAFGILGGGSHALSLAKNKIQLDAVNTLLKKEFGNIDIDEQRWESLTLSEQGKALDALTGVYRDAMQRSRTAKDNASRQAAVREATYARLLFMRLGLKTRQSVLQGVDAEEKLAQAKEKYNTLKKEAKKRVKEEAKRTTTDREGNSTWARYNDKEYTVYNTEGVTVTQDENGNPHLLGKGTLYLRAPETEGGSAEIIPVPSDQVEVIATQPKEEVDAAIEQLAEAEAEAALQQELATQEAESAPMAQEAETEAAPIPTAQEADTKIAPIPTAQEAETKIAPIPTAQEAETKIAPIPKAQVAKTEAAPIPTAQEAETEVEAQYLSPEEAARLPEEERTKAISNFNNSLSETDAAIEKLAKEQREYLRKRNTRKRQEETEEDYQNRKAEARKATTGDLQRVNTEMALLQHKKENLIRSLTALHAETPKTEEAASGATESAVNDLNENSPAAHRARGFKLIGGKRIPRQGRVKCYIGRRISAQVSHTEETEGGHYAVIEADDLQPSHFDAAVNERHFIPEAQPKDRATTASFEQQEDFGRNLRVPNLIFSEASIYSGAPVVNARGEVIQGNGRSAGIKSAYRSHPESSGRYKEYLTEHAADWGLKREDVAGMKAPVLVHMLDVDDEEAIRLGQFTDNDVTVTGGTENTKNLLPENVILKLPTEKQGEVARILFASDEADGDKIADEKFSSAFLYLYQHNAISLEEYNSLFTANSLNSQDGVRKPLEAAKRELVTRLLDSVFTKVDPTLKAIVFGRKSVPGIKREQLDAIKRLLLTDFFFTTSADAQTRARSLRNDLLGALLFISKYPGPSDRTITEGMDPLRTFLRNMFSAAPVLPGMKSLAESFSPESLEIANLFFKSPEAINDFTRKYYSETNPQTLFEQSEATQSLSKEELFRQEFPFYQEAHRIAYARREASFDAPLTEHHARKESAERGEAGYHKTDFGYESGNKENGKYIAIDKKGNYIEQSEWRNGKRHGISTLYYPNGNVRCEGRFFEGAPAGAFTEYNSKGQLTRHFTFPKDGREATGVYTDYYQNEAHSVEGCIRSKGAFKAGQREGVWKHYDKEGNLILTENYSHGTLQGSYLKLQPVDENFGSHVQAQYVDGQPEGRYIEMHEGSDAVKFEGSIERGKFVGKRDGSGSPYLLGEPLHTTFDLSTDAFRHGERKEITLTDKEGNSLTVQLSDEKDRNGKPYVLTSDGKLSYGVIPGGLIPEEPKTKEVRLSLGNDVREEGTYRYGLVHIMEDHYAQMKSFGFDTVESYIKHILNNIGEAVFEKRYEGKTTHFVFTVPFPSRSHPSRENTDSILVEIGDESDHWEVISTWRTGKSFIEKKKKEAEAAVPAIGLPHATNVAEGHQNGTTEGSNSAVVAGTQNLPLSDDKDTKKSEPSEVSLEKGTNDVEGVQKELTLTDYKGKSVTLRVSDEKDRNGKPYVFTSDGKLSYGVVPGGLLSGETEAKEVRISLGDDDYGMTRMVITNGIKESGFKTVEAYIQHVLRNASQMEQCKRLFNGMPRYQITTHPFTSALGKDTIDILYVIPSADGTFWENTSPWRTTKRRLNATNELEQRNDKRDRAFEEKHEKDEALREPRRIETLRKEEATGDEAFRIGDEPNGKRVSERTWHQLIDRLRKSGLAVEFVTDSKTFSEKLNSLNIRDRELIGDKTVYGFVDKRTGVVYLNPETMDANTPLHECAHLWNALIRKLNPELWARGRYLIEQSPYAFEVRNEEAYSGLSAEERADEALARAIADRGEKILKRSGMRGLALRAWIRDVWQHILAFFGIKQKANTLNDFTDMALGDLLNGQGRSYEIPKEKEASQILFRIGNKRRAEYRDRLHKKRPDLSDVAIEKTLDAIEAFGEEEAGEKGDSKLETLALHWTLQGSIDLTREADANNLDDIPDSTLVRQAAEAARRKKVDPMQYNSPKTLLSDIAEGMTFDKRLDPDKEPCFTARHEVPGTDIVVYDVADDKKGQQAVRAFVDSHWGVNANPWCLITRNVNAWNYWNHYNYIQKQIAFQNGKLLAFKACDRDSKQSPWWNRQDKNSPGVPIRKDLGEGKYLPISVEETTGTPIGKTAQYALRGERGGNLYEEWTPDGKHILFREKRDGADKFYERWTPKGVLIERYEQKNGNVKNENWNARGRLILLFIGSKSGNIYSEWHENGKRKAFKLSRNGNVYSIEWNKKGKRSYLEEKDKDGNERIEDYYENGKHQLLEEKDKDGNERKEKWYENGKRKLLEVKDKEGNERKEKWYENGKRKLLEVKDKDGNERKEQWYENGKRQSLETKDKDGNEYAEIWLWTGQRRLFETTDKNGNRRTEEWHENGKRFSLETEDKEGNRHREEWYKNGQRQLLETTSKDGRKRKEGWHENGQRQLLETTDKEGCKYTEEWDENGTRKDLSIYKRSDNVIYKIGLDEKGEVKSAQYINFNDNSISFRRKNGELTETFRMGTKNPEEALREIAQAFLEETGEEFRFPDTKPTDEDVQYRKGAQEGGAKPQDAPLETFTPERARDTLAKLRAAKPIAVDVAKARELYDFTPKGVRTWILNTLRNRTFKNEDTGENDIILSRRGADKFVSHGMHNEVRAASASVIPELIYKGVFIGETNAEKDDAHYVRYRYYAAGLKVSEEEYTVKIVVGIDKYGKSFYDQELTAIEKGRLIDILNQPAEGFTATAVGPIPSTSLVGKDTKLLSLLGDLTEKAGEAWEATDNPQSAADEVAQHDAYRHALTTQYGEAARNREADKARKQRVAEDALRKLGLEGVPVEVVSRDDVAEAYARDAMGWHDRKTGKVTIVAENNELEDIEATVLHEVVGHHGLEALLGKEGLATLTHEVLPLIPEAERKRLEDTYGTNEQTIAEEYIAEMAEQYTPPSIWARIAGFIRNLLRRIGFRLPLTNGDLLYLTWRGIRATRKEQSSTDALLHRADEKRVIARCRDLDDIQFRKPRKQILSELAADGVDEKGVLKLTEAMNELLEKRVYKLRETWQNDTQSFVELARCVEAATGETIPDEMNLDKVYNQSASKAFARQEETRKKYDEMMQTVRRFARKAQLSPELTELYFLAKHAPERNAEMRRRAEELFDPTRRTEEQEEILNDYYNKLFPGWYKQHEDAYSSKAEAEEAFFDALKDALTTKDYAAEEAITERIATLIKQDKKSPYRAVVNEADPLRAFTQAVEARAGHQDVYQVWQLVNGFNRGTIELWRNSGMIDEATYQKVTGMFAHYVPMQGWKENTNQTPWEYSIRTHIDTNPLKTMHGRQSLPGGPFEAMLKSAMNSIVAATRNEERQALYFFAQQYGSDYLSASSAWYVLQQEGDKKRWVEAYPETVTRKTTKGDAIESTTQETAEAFFARMKELESRGLARRRTQRTRPETGYLLSERQEQEHVVPLFFDGQKYNVFVNGNPRFSRAATRHNRATDSNGAADKLLRSVRWFTREMGQNITGRSLSFGAANMVRDLLFAEMSSSTIYGTRYALAFNRAYFTDVIPLMLGLKKGDTARLYEEYKANGGRTGFAFLTGDKRSAQSTRNALSNSLKARAGRAGRSFWNAYMGINEHLEDMSRFAAYAAARKIGLGITEATHRAKSITVNFNKRGTGNSAMYQFLSTLYLFFNANLQGVALTGKMFRDHPWRAAGWSLGLILLQPLMTILYTALASPDGDDGDDEDETLQERYDRLPLKDVNPFLRRSNICIPLGEGKLIKVPLGPEMRALNGIGVTLSDMLMGRATSGDLALATIDGALNSSSIGLDMSLSGFTDANELAERGERGALYSALRGSIPSALQPFGDIAANRDWSGRRIYGESVYHRGTPSYLYADKSTPRWMTNAAAGWNTMLYGQGDKHIGEVSTGLLSVNPSSVNYLAERYLGGILEFVTDLNRSADMLTDPKGGSVSQALGQAPVTRRFWKDDPFMEGSEARRNFYRTRRALRQDIERIDRMKRNAKNADYKEANEIRQSIRTYLDGRNEMQLRYLAKRFDALSDTMQAHDEAYAGKDTETRLSVRERDTRAIRRLLEEAENQLGVRK